MSKPPAKANVIREFILRKFETIAAERRQGKITLSNLPKYKTKKDIIDSLYASGQFFDLANNDTDRPLINQICVSRNTIGNVINAMIDDGVIGKENGEYVLLPSYNASKKNYPITQIANQIEIKVLKPESMFFLEVPQNTAGMISDYINAQFYLGDIKAIPFGNIVMCMGVLPESAFKYGHIKDPDAEYFTIQMLLDVLKDFNVTYPDFRYKTAYKMGYLIQNDAKLREELRETAKKAATTLGELDKDEYNRLCKQFFVDIPLLSDTIGREIAFDSSPDFLIKKPEDNE